MLVIKYILLLLSLGQFIHLEAFWRSHFIWFFVWMISLHLEWFYFESRLYKIINNVMICLLTVINIVLLPKFPIFMLGLLVIEWRQLYTRKITGLLVAGLSVVLILIWSLWTAWPSVDYLLMTLAVVTLAVYLTEQTILVDSQKAEIYTFRTQTDLQDSNLLALKAQMIATEENHTLNERNRISRDLHDSVGHTLSTIVIQLAAIAKLTEDKAPQAAAMLEQLHQFTKSGLADVRQVIHRIKPQHYQRIAFIEQVRHIISDFEQNSPIKVYFNNNQLLWELSPEQELLFVRAIQEFLGNSNKHSQATEVRIQCHFTDSTVILTMADDGKGTEVINPQMGIVGMQERTKLLGGKVQIQSALNKGFKPRIVLPKGGVANVKGN